MLRIVFAPLGLTLGVLLAACSDTGSSAPSAARTGQGGGSSADLVSFDDDVHPILSSKCVPCHEASTPDRPGHGALNPDAAFNAVQGMSKGQPVYLRILARASGEDPAGFMPPDYAGCEDGLGAGTCLSVAELELIELWVEQGASQR